MVVALIRVGLLAGAAAGIALVGGWRRRYVEVTVTGMSMRPTYRSGDRVLVRRVPGQQLRVGDVIVVEKPDGDGNWAPSPTGQWMIKRLAALPGDPVPADLATLPEPLTGTVPAGCAVVLGDAGADSRDSKQLGFFPLPRVLGVAIRPR